MTDLTLRDLHQSLHAARDELARADYIDNTARMMEVKAEARGRIASLEDQIKAKMQEAAETLLREFGACLFQELTREEFDKRVVGKAEEWQQGVSAMTTALEKALPVVSRDFS